MEILSQEDLRDLFEHRHRFCVSVYLSTPREGKEVGAGRIQLKDLLRDAGERLSGAGLREAERKTLLAPAQQLLESSEFWRHESDGLAVFLAPGFFRYFRLPLRLPAFVAVQDCFEITPLLPLWTSEDPFYLLVLSLNHVRVLHATRYAVSELDVQGMPRSLRESLASQVDESARQQHTAKAGLPEDELRYFRQIDEALRRSCKNHQVPLVLAGVEKDVSLYRHINRYQGLLEGCVVGNPDRLTTRELHAKGLEIAQAHYARRKEQALQNYRECKNAARISHQIEQIVLAAHQGRVFHLFVAAGAEKWGRFDAEQNVVIVHETAEKGDQELLNLAVIQTILHEGTVFVLQPAEVPADSVIAALYRY